MSEPTPLLAPLMPALVAPRLWTGERFVADPWQLAGAGDALPASGQIIVSLARWRAEQPARKAHAVQFGILVQPSEVLDPDADDLDQLGVIALVFPKFSDGRAYSTARRLRDAFNYGGEIRATGDVLLDQLPLMMRAGFDAFQIVDAATIRALKARPVPAVSRVYQPATESSRQAWRPRRATLSV